MSQADSPPGWLPDSPSSDTDLTEDECWARLEAEPVGRIAFTDGDTVHIYPVNHVVRERNLYFRTSPYGIIGTAIRHQAVAFEIDAVDPATHSGWSVVVRGTANWVVDSDRLAELASDRSTAPAPWAAGSRTMHIRIAPQSVSGRTIGAA